MIFDLNKNIFGLDISDRAIRLIKVGKKGKKITLNSFNELEIPDGIIVNGEIIQEDKLADLIKKLVSSTKGRKINIKNVISVLPETKTFIKVIDIPINRDKKEFNIEDLVKKEIVNHIPLNPDEIYLDWQIVSEDSDNIKILIGAAPQNIVNSYSLALEKGGLIPYVLEIEAVAIVRGLIEEEDNKTKIIIDFGAARTGLILYDNKTIKFTVSLPISGNKITETIAQTLKLEYKKAEEAKIVCGLDPNKCEGALLKILLNNIDSLIRQIKKIITYYQSNFPDHNDISEIIICGGGANFGEIDQLLSEKLKIPVKIGNPFANITQTKKISIPKEKILSYTTAIGLALRSWYKKDII